jgi:hypothetical protein
MIESFVLKVHLLVGFDFIDNIFIEDIDLSEAHRGELRFVVIDDCFSEFLVGRESIFVLTGNFDEFVRKDLHDFGATVGTDCAYLPFEEVFLRVELDCVEGVLDAFEC